MTAVYLVRHAQPVYQGYQETPELAPLSVGKSWMVLGVCAALFVIFNVILFRRSIFRRKAVTK